MRVRPAGREACNCASPYNSILERLTAMEAEILTAMQEANTAVGIANTALRQVQAADIRTVNQIQPDADGEFSITAGTGIQINAGTNGIEIENISEGAVYTGISPIEVNADNEISLKGWGIYNSTDWSTFIDADNIVIEDVLIIARWNDVFLPLLIPKGFKVPPTSYVYYLSLGSTRNNSQYSILRHPFSTYATVSIYESSVKINENLYVSGTLKYSSINNIYSEVLSADKVTDMTTLCTIDNSRKIAIFRRSEA